VRRRHGIESKKAGLEPRLFRSDEARGPFGSEPGFKIVFRLAVDDAVAMVDTDPGWRT